MRRGVGSKRRARCTVLGLGLDCGCLGGGLQGPRYVLLQGVSSVLRLQLQFHGPTGRLRRANRVI